MELKERYIQVLPPIWPYPRTIYVMWIPAPYWIKTLRFQVKGSFQSWRIMESKIGTKPVENPRLSRHHADIVLCESRILEAKGVGQLHGALQMND